jgi:hypothetical protein
VSGRSRTGAALLATLVLGPWAAARADVYVLIGGDRITGKTLLKGTKTFRVQTPYGRLVIPRAKVERILRDDGTDEVVNAPEAPPAPPPPPLRLVLVITGKSFWHAWDPPRGTTVDPTLRLELRLDEETVATCVDAESDPADLPGAKAINTFSFDPDTVAMVPAPGVAVTPPETRPGRVVLKIDLGAERAGRHRLRIAYQVNDRTADEAAWRDVAATTAEVELSEGAPAFLQVRQDAGRMTFSGFTRRSMKNVETFRLEARAEAPE